MPISVTRSDSDFIAVASGVRAMHRSGGFGSQTRELYPETTTPMDVHMKTSWSPYLSSLQYGMDQDGSSAKIMGR